MSAHRFLLMCQAGLLLCLCSACQQAPQNDTDQNEASAKADSGAPAAPEEKPIDPDLVTTPGVAMTPARAKAVAAHLKKIGEAFHDYLDQTLHFLPGPKEHPEYFDAEGRLKVSWRVHLLPFLDQKQLYEQFKLDEAWDSPHNAPLAKQMPEIYRSPDTPAGSEKTRFRLFEGKRTKNEEGNERISTLFPLGEPASIRDTLDGLTNTLLIVEVGPDKAEVWTNPRGLSFEHPKAELGNTAANVAVLMSDRGVTYIKRDIDESEWKALIGPQEGTLIFWEEIQLPPAAD
jgi:hypothetical protein